MTKKITTLFLLAAIMAAGLVGFSATAAKAETLNIAISKVFNTGALDPSLNNGSANQQYLGYIFEALIGRELDGNLNPQLATSWGSNKEATIWTVKLRKGVKFHDWGKITGETLKAEDLEMTAEDVKFSIEHFMAPDSHSSNSTRLRKFIKDIVVKDRYTVEINLKSPGADFVEFYFLNGNSSTEGWIMSKKYWDKVGAEGFKKHPIGTNLYKFTEYRNKDFIKLDAVKDHWSGVVPAFDRIVVMEVPEESAREAMLKRGDADLIDTRIDKAVSLKKEGYGVKVVEVAPQVLRLYGTWQEAAVKENLPTTHVKVRKALSLAINRQEIVDNMFGGLLNPYVFPGLWGTFGKGLDVKKWEAWAKEAYRYDPEQAKALLKEAGFPNGCEIKVWSFKQGPGGEYAPQLWELIASYWEKIGVKTIIQPSDYAGVVRPMFRKNPQPKELLGTITMQTGNPNPFPMLKMAQFLGLKTSTQRFLDQTNKEWMDLCDLVQSETDFDKQVEYYNKLAKIVGDQYILIGLWYQAQPYAASAKLSEWDVVRGLGTPSAWLKTFKAAK